MQMQLPKSILLTTALALVAILTYLSVYSYPHWRPVLVSSTVGPEHCTPAPVDCSRFHEDNNSSSETDRYYLNPPDVSNEGTTHRPGMSSSKPDNPSKILQAAMLAGEVQTPLYEKMLKTHAVHQRRWGYRTEVLRHFIRGHGQWENSIWSKPLFVLQLLIAELAKAEEDRSEWIVWFDSDTIILNPNIDWSIFLPPDDFFDVDMIGSRDWNGLNCGVFFVRVTEWSVNFFTEVVAVPLVNPLLDLGFNLDQSAMREVLRKPTYKSRFLYQPVNWHNGFHDSGTHFRDVQPGDLLVHFAGVKAGGHEHLVAAITGWFETVDNGTSNWALPLDETFYNAEIVAYWDRLRHGRALCKEVEDVRDLHRGDLEMDPSVKLALDALEGTYSAFRGVFEDKPFEAVTMNDAMAQLEGTITRLKTAEQFRSNSSQPVQTNQRR